MSWIESIACRISPEWAYKREAWRQELDYIKNYDAAAPDRNNTNWRASNQSAEQTDKYSRDSIRARARDLERNSDMAVSVLKAFKRNIVGGGYKLQAKTKNPDLNKIIEGHWKEWCEKENCDVTGTQSFNQMLRMAVERKKVDGGILFVKRYTEGGLVPFKLQVMEVDELDQSFISSNDSRVIGGVKYNEYNRPIGYYIKQYSLDGFSLPKPVYVPAEDVIFIYTKKRPSQIREISDMTPTITRIRDVNEYMVAVSIKERIAACLAVFIKKLSPSGGIGRSGNSSSDHKSYSGKTLMPGMISELNVNEEAQVINPSGQATDAATYIKLQQRLLGAGQGLSYEATSRDMSEVNYSSARQANIEDDLEYREEIELFEGFMSEVYKTFVYQLYLSSLITVRDFLNNKKEYLKHEWVKAPKRWIDPVKEANANRIALNTGQKTFQDIAAENGRDWKEQLENMKEVLEYANKLGFELGGVIYGKSREELYGASEESKTNT